MAEGKRFNLQLPPGIVTDLTETDAVGRYIDSEWVRWRDGLPEKIAGYERLSLVGGPIIGEVRGVHDWVSIDGQSWVAIGTAQKLYLINGLQLYDITPVRRTVSRTDPLETSSGSPIVTVTDATHGAQAGDRVRLDGASAVGGLTLDGEYVITAILDADRYTVTAASNASSSATGGGVISFSYDIPIGLEDAADVQGWGTGNWGAGNWGQGSGGGIRRPPRTWSLVNFGEDLLASFRSGPMYYWDRSEGPNSRAVVVPEAPANIEVLRVAPEQRIVVAFGAGLGSQAAPQPQDKLLIRWCDAENFRSWTATLENQAGEQRIDSGSQIISAEISRGQFIVATDESLHALVFTGGFDVFVTRFLGRATEVASPMAGTDFNGIYVMLTRGDFVLYDGTVRVLPCTVKERVFGSFNLDQADKVAVSLNEEFSEIWWFYPSDEGSNKENDRYVIYNWLYNAWYFGTLARTAFHDASPYLGRPYGFSGGFAYAHESASAAGADSNGDPIAIESALESYFVEIEDGDLVYSVNQMIPDFPRLIGEIDLIMRARKYPQGAVTEKGPYAFDATDTRVNTRVRGRQISFRIETDEVIDDWRMGSWTAKVTPDGRR